jgi:LysR family transcriptional regulator of gallate degradation
MDTAALNLRQLRAMLAVVDSGSVTAASRLVNRTQPAVTQGISKLERQFELALFERGPSGMKPTEAALTLAPRVRQALRLIGSHHVTATQMRALALVAAHGGYSAAAAIGGLSEASLHRSVRDLSIGFRQRLVERRRRGAVLTWRGQEILRQFRLAEAELRSALVEIASLRGPQQIGRIVVGAMPLSRARVLPAAIAAFHRLRPGSDVSIIESAYSDLIGPLRDGDIDLMVGALRDPAKSEGLLQIPLFEDRPVILGRRGHPMSCAAGQIEASRLVGYPWIVPPVGTPLRQLWKSMFETAGLGAPHVSIECGSVMMIRQMLVDSDFLALLSPDQVAAELEAGWLAKIGDPPCEISRTIGLTVRADWRPTTLQNLFLDCLQTAARPAGSSA